MCLNGRRLCRRNSGSTADQTYRERAPSCESGCRLGRATAQHRPSVRDLIPCVGVCAVQPVVPADTVLSAGDAVTRLDVVEMYAKGKGSTAPSDAQAREK